MHVTWALRKREWRAWRVQNMACCVEGDGGWYELSRRILSSEEEDMTSFDENTSIPSTERPLGLSLPHPSPRTACRISTTPTRSRRGRLGGRIAFRRRRAHGRTNGFFPGTMPPPCRTFLRRIRVGGSAVMNDDGEGNRSWSLSRLFFALRLRCPARITRIRAISYLCRR